MTLGSLAEAEETYIGVRIRQNGTGGMAMITFDEYANKYRSVRMERRNGILQITFHTDGGSLDWSTLPHIDFVQAFSDIGSDPENKVVIMTGTGDIFSSRPAGAPQRLKKNAQQWDESYWRGTRLLLKLLDIEVPMISAINGPATFHAELPLLCDIVLAAEEATIQDSAHIMRALAPGDGVHIVFPLLLGLNRGRYFLLTGQTLSARQALELGLVNEVLPRRQLLPRAWELAEQLAQQPPLVIRYSRILLTQHLKGLMHDLLGYGLALEGLSQMDEHEV